MSHASNMSQSVGLMDSATDASASAIGRMTETLEPLTLRILQREHVVETLQELRRLAKGNGAPPCLCLVPPG